MSPDQTALMLFRREVLLPEVRRAVEDAVAPLIRRQEAVEKRLKKVEQRVDVWASFVHHVNEQVDIVDMKLEALDSLWKVAKATAEAVGAKVPWKVPDEDTVEEVR